LAERDFRPLFGAPSAEAWLLDASAPHGLPVAIMALPVRQLDPWLLRRVVRAQRADLALHVLCQPMNHSEPSWRWISPTAFASDGMRWHLRAWNHDAARHEHLLFPRMVEMGEERAAGLLPEDYDWQQTISVRLRPAARLSLGQRQVIEADYGMAGGEAMLEVRLAMLFLFLRRLGLDRSDSLVELANQQEIDAAMADALARFNKGGIGN